MSHLNSKLTVKNNLQFLISLLFLVLFIDVYLAFLKKLVNLKIIYDSIANEVEKWQLSPLIIRNVII